MHRTELSLGAGVANLLRFSFALGAGPGALTSVGLFVFAPGQPS